MASDYRNQKFKSYINELKRNRIIKVYAEDVAEIERRCKLKGIAITKTTYPTCVTIKKEEIK